VALALLKILKSLRFKINLVMELGSWAQVDRIIWLVSHSPQKVAPPKFCYPAPAAYLCLGAYVFYIVYLRTAAFLTVYEKDPCRSRRQEFKANATLADRECKYCELSTVNLGTSVFRKQFQRYKLVT